VPGDEVLRTLPLDLLPHLVESMAAVAYVLRVGHVDEAPLYVSPQAREVIGVPAELLRADADRRNELLHPDDRDRIRRAAAASDRIDAGPWDQEYRVRQDDGSYRWVRDQATVLPPQGGHPALWIGVVTDVSAAHGAAPGDHSTGEPPFRTLVETLPAIVYIDSHERTPASLYVSPQTTEVSGYSPEEWLADRDLWWKLLHPDDRERMRREWALAHERGGVLDTQYRLFHRDGRVIWMEDVARLVHADDGTPLFWQGIAFDVTDRKRAEQALADSEARYRALVERLPGVVYLCTDEPDPVMVYVSPPLLELTGYTPEAWMACDQQLWDETIHPQDRERVLDVWEEAVRTRTTFQADYRIVRADGDERWITDEASLVWGDDEGRAFWQGLMRDVTAERASARALEESEARYRALVEQLPAVVYRMRPDDERRTLYVSPHVEDVLGYTREEWLEQPDIWIELLHPDDREIELDAHDRLTETGEPWIQEYRLIANDGRVVWVRDQAILTRDADGEPVWQGVLLDITTLKDLEQQLRGANDMLELRVLERTTDLEDANEMMTLEIDERRRVEAELRETRERYRHLVEDLPAVVFLWQVRPHDVALAYTSPQIERLLGFSPEEWNHPTFWATRLHPHDRDRVIAATERSSTTGEPFELEFRYFARDGRVVWVLSHASLLRRDDRGRPLLFQGVLLDITDQKEAEREARTVEARFEAVTTLAPVAFYDFDVERTEPERITFRSVSPMIARMVGLEPEEFVHDPRAWLRSVHPDDRDAITADSLQQLRTGGTATRSYRVIGPGGEISWVRSESRTVERDERGLPTRIQGAIVDISREMEEIERLRRAEHTLRSFVDEIPGMPWVEVVDGEPGSARLVFIGPQVVWMLGYSPDELIGVGDHASRIVHPEDRARIAALWTLHDRTAEPFWAEYRALRRDGRVLWLRSQALASRDERGRLRWHGVSYDVTAEHEGPESNVTSEPIRLPERS
jgi:PAS domain S-box-containing protein